MGQVAVGGRVVAEVIFHLLSEWCPKWYLPKFPSDALPLLGREAIPSLGMQTYQLDRLTSHR